MTPSIDISDRTRSRLEELQAEISSETGRDLSVGEVASRLILKNTERSPEQGGEEFTGLSDEEIEMWLSGTTESGDPVDEDDIDDIVTEFD